LASDGTSAATIEERKRNSGSEVRFENTPLECQVSKAPGGEFDRAAPNAISIRACKEVWMFGAPSIGWRFIECNAIVGAWG
jgi:hypothetical protein